MAMMGKFIKYSCDRCSDIVNIPLPKNDIYGDEDAPLGWKIVEDNLLCENCVASFLKWLDTPNLIVG